MPSNSSVAFYIDVSKRSIQVPKIGSGRIHPAEADLHSAYAVYENDALVSIILYSFTAPAPSATHPTNNDTSRSSNSQRRQCETW
jgi:hypothetical protein